MGCDIHPVVQVRKGSTWVDAEGWDDRYGHKNYGPRESPDGEWDVLSRRNYAVFSVLAGVRNRGDVVPISDPRGLPEGFEINEDYSRANGFWMGDHSYSWVTLRELLEYPWEELPKDEREHCGLFRKAILPWMETLGAPDDVRVVFGFDS